MSAGFWRPYLERIEEAVASGTAPSRLHWHFRACLGNDGTERVHDWLWNELRRELRRRNLHGSGGDRLGPDFAHYLAIDDHDEDLRCDLVTACLERVFSGPRLARYVNDCTNPDWDPDRLIALNVRHLVHELQSKGDPGGTALYKSLQSAAVVAEGVELDEESRTVRFGSGGSVPESELVRSVFEENGALVELSQRLESRYESDAATHLCTASVRDELARGLTALAAEGDAACRVGELVRALRPSIPTRARREELHPDVSAPQAFDQELVEFAGLGPRAIEAVQRAPGLQRRMRANLLALLEALIRDAEAGTGTRCVQQLGWAKQSLSDRRRRLREVLLEQLALPASAGPGAETPEDAR